VADVPGVAEPAVEETAVEDDAPADTGRDDHRYVVVAADGSAAPPLGQGEGLGVVLHERGEARVLSKAPTEGEGLPAGDVEGRDLVATGGHRATAADATGHEAIRSYLGDRRGGQAGQDGEELLGARPRGVGDWRRLVRVPSGQTTAAPIWCRRCRRPAPPGPRRGPDQRSRSQKRVRNQSLVPCTVFSIPPVEPDGSSSWRERGEVGPPGLAHPTQVPLEDDSGTEHHGDAEQANEDGLRVKGHEDCQAGDEADGCALEVPARMPVDGL